MFENRQIFLKCSYWKHRMYANVGLTHKRGRSIRDQCGISLLQISENWALPKFKKIFNHGRKFSEASGTEKPKIVLLARRWLLLYKHQDQDATDSHKILAKASGTEKPKNVLLARRWLLLYKHQDQQATPDFESRKVQSWLTGPPPRDPGIQHRDSTRRQE